MSPTSIRTAQYKPRVIWHCRSARVLSQLPTVPANSHKGTQKPRKYSTISTLRTELFKWPVSTVFVELSNALLASWIHFENCVHRFLERWNLIHARSHSL